jgi:serine/threonine-protein phosphatase 2B catalytic subunit
LWSDPCADKDART